MPKIICDFTHKLNKLNEKIKPKRGPDYNPFYLINTFKKLKQNKNKIQSIFGDKYSILISSSMDIIEYFINEVNKSKIDSGPIQAIHYDLHPHNLLFRGDRISAIIDYDSILYMPIGYAIAFSSLKLCRQHLVLNKPKDSKKIGEKFMLVKTDLVVDNEEVSINYLLLFDNNKWRIFDVLLAGSISEIATKKSEFSSFIRDGKITPLINALKKKNSVLND